MGLPTPSSPPAASSAASSRATLERRQREYPGFRPFGRNVRDPEDLDPDDPATPIILRLEEICDARDPKMYEEEAMELGRQLIEVVFPRTGGRKESDTSAGEDEEEDYDEDVEMKAEPVAESSATSGGETDAMDVEEEEAMAQVEAMLEGGDRGEDQA